MRASRRQAEQDERDRIDAERERQAGEYAAQTARANLEYEAKRARAAEERKAEEEEFGRGLLASSPEVCESRAAAILAKGPGTSGSWSQTHLAAQTQLLWAITKRLAAQGGGDRG